MNYHRFLEPACAVMDVARDMLLAGAPGMVTAKGDRDMASELDYSIERRLRGLLADLTPEVGFLGEEEGRSGPDGALVWALDPIDGTVNFVHGSPLCAISLALLADDTPVLGVIDLPLLGRRRYTAVTGHGAWSDGRRLAVSTVGRLDQAVVALGDYAVGADAEQRNVERIEVTRCLAARALRIRMHGTAALDFAFLAEGAVDAVVILSNSSWDVAAGVVIAREAGALVVDRDGSRHDHRSQITVAGSPALVPDLVAATDRV